MPRALEQAKGPNASSPGGECALRVASVSTSGRKATTHQSVAIAPLAFEDSPESTTRIGPPWMIASAKTT